MDNFDLNIYKRTVLYNFAKNELTKVTTLCTVIIIRAL